MLRPLCLIELPCREDPERVEGGRRRIIRREGEIRLWAVSSNVSRGEVIEV